MTCLKKLIVDGRRKKARENLVVTYLKVFKILFMKQNIYILILSIMIANCSNQSENTKKETANNPENYAPGSFGYDLSFLQKYDSIIVLRNGESGVIISPKYQAKVFTSTADDMQGKSFGWINYKAFQGPLDPHINAYGGENRLWLGPEGGKYSLFFPKDSAMEFKNWRTPAAFDSEAWELVSKNNDSAVLKKEMQLTNYAGTVLNLLVNRRIKLLDKRGMENLLQVNTGSDVKWVGYRTENTITNTGSNEWNSTTGMPCIWMLDMFPPSDSTVVVIPYKDGNGLPANTEYFGKIPEDRIHYKNNVLFFKADGKQRGKLGIKPERALPVAGSYDAANQILTIALFDVNPLGKYLNQEWRTDKAPFSGDAVNSYNDGPLADRKQLGPFYELESVSTPAFLPPGHSATHWHSVFHFTGDEKDLDLIAKKVLGTSIETIKTIFH